MSLSDCFPDQFRKEFAERNLKIGSVIRVLVNDTNPPKEKRFILVGQSYDKSARTIAPAVKKTFGLFL